MIKTLLNLCMLLVLCAGVPSENLPIFNSVTMWTQGRTSVFAKTKFCSGFPLNGGAKVSKSALSIPNE